MHVTNPQHFGHTSNLGAVQRQYMFSAVIVVIEYVSEILASRFAAVTAGAYLLDMFSVRCYFDIMM